MSRKDYGNYGVGESIEDSPSFDKHVCTCGDPACDFDTSINYVPPIEDRIETPSEDQLVVVIQAPHDRRVTITIDPGY